MEKLLRITQIKVPPRARVDYGDLPDLARKIIATKGLKGGNLTIEEKEGNYFLLAGGRRYKAHQLILSSSKDAWGEVEPTEEELKMYFEIPCTVLTDLTEEDRARIELVENLSRKNYDWPEAATLVESFHKLMQEKYGKGISGSGKKGWSTRDTAKELGLNSADVVYYLQLHKAMITDPSLKDIRQKSKAITKLKRTSQTLMADLLDIEDYSFEDVRIVCGDSKEIVPTLADNSVNMVLTDPPWAIGFENRVSDMRKESLSTVYDKDYDIMDTLEILTHCYNKMKPNTPIYMFYSAFPEKVLEGQKLLVSAGFEVERIPLLWYKKHILAHDSNETKHGYNYESILYGWKGERPFFNHSSRNVLECQVAFQGRIHSGEKPEALLVEIIKLHTKEGDMILDPFGGSCKVADACKSSLRKCLVVELDESLVKMATLRVRGL